MFLLHTLSEMLEVLFSIFFSCWYSDAVFLKWNASLNTLLATSAEISDSLLS